MVMPSVSQNNWTVAKLHALPDDGNKYEIIDGVLYVTPAPRMPHQRAISELIRHVWQYAYAVGIMPMISPADIQFSDRTVVQPDMFVFLEPPGTRALQWTDITSLVLAIDVLSPRTAKRDRTVKRRLYQTQNTLEYWIVDANARTIERWRPDSTEAEILTTTLTWQPVAAHRPLQIDLIEYFRAVHGD
jgi:Uma2 family endonuclease